MFFSSPVESPLLSNARHRFKTVPDVDACGASVGMTGKLLLGVPARTEQL